MLSIEVVDTLEKFKQLEPEWNEAVSRSRLNIPFMTYEWFYSWWQVYGRKNEMLVLVAREGGEIVGIAPLMRTRVTLLGFSFKAVTFMDNYHSERNGIISTRDHREVMECMFAYLKNSPYRYNILILHALEKDSPVDAGIRSALFSEGAHVIEIKDKQSPYIPISGEWTAYFKSRAKNVRSKVKRVCALAAPLGGIDIAEYSSCDDIAKAMAEVLSVSKRTWKYRNKTAIANDKDHERFYRLLAESFSRNNWLRIWVLKIGGVPAAFQYNLEYNGIMYSLKIGFAEEFRHISPSKLLASHIIKYCFDGKYKEFDLLGQNEPHKMDWTSACREHCKYMYFNDTFLGRMLYLLETKVVRQVKSKFLKSFCLSVVAWVIAAPDVLASVVLPC